MADQTKVFASRDLIAYQAPWDPDNAFPADSVLFGTPWGTVGTMPSPWVNLGYTEGGLHLRTQVDRGAINVDQTPDPVLRPVTGRDTRLSTNLAEFDPDTVVMATGQGSVTTVAATTALRGHQQWDLDSDINTDYQSLAFDSLHPGDQEALRAAGWKGIVLGSPQFDWQPTAALLTPFEIACVPDTSVVPARIAAIRDIIPIS